MYPVLSYRDARAAIDWLCDAFGFNEHAVHAAPDGSIMHAELEHYGGYVMIGGDREDDDERGFGSHAGQGWAYVVLDEDVDAHYVRALEAGAEIVMEPTDQEYGSRDYSARDPEGNLWSFGTYTPGDS